MAPYQPASRAVRILALVQLGVLVVTNTRFGLHGDELYYLACAAHLDWGYVDIGPVVPWVVAGTTAMIGDSTFAVRLPAAIAAASLVLLSGRLARQMGGNNTAQILTALAVMVAPAILRASYMIQAPALEPLAWTGCVLILVSILQGAPPTRWLLFGVVAGLGLLIKPTMLLFGSGVLAGLLLTRHRPLLTTRWPWLGGLVALGIYLPHLIWQAVHGFPTLEFTTSIQDRVLEGISPVEFLIGQVIYVHPFNAPIWLAGLWVCLVSRRSMLAPLGWTYLTCLGVFLLSHAKAYYLLPIYPSLLAAGALGLQPWLDHRPWRRNVSYAVLAIGGLIFAPAALALLPIKQMEAYTNAITLGAMENSSEVTDDLRRMHGWREQVEAMAEAYDRLSPDEQTRCVIWTGSYSDAAAVDYFGRDRGLPRAVSGHMSYFLWGPPAADKDVVITAGGSRQRLGDLFRTVEEGPTALSEDSMWRSRIIWICRGPRFTWKTLWPEAKRY